MTKYLIHIVFLIILALFSCENKTADLMLDDLVDMQEYQESLEVNCEIYKEQKVERLIINHESFDPDRILTLSESGYYRMEIFLKNATHQKPEVIRLVILDEERGEAEWGLKKWSPRELTPGIIDNRIVTRIYPKLIPPEINLPIVVITSSDITLPTEIFNAEVAHSSFKVKRGYGSVQIPHDQVDGAVLSIDHRTFPLITSSFTASPMVMNGTLETDLDLPPNTYLHINNDLIIPSGISLSIDNGSFVVIDPGINIYHEGSLHISGSDDNPVTFTCSVPGEYWGGFIATEPGNLLEASHVIFANSGYYSGGDYNYGHAHHQALFYCEQGVQRFNHCYMIDHAGQVFYPISATINIDHCLIQRAITGGQVNYSQLTLSHSMFSDFPDDSQEYQDKDNDGLYLMGSDALITKTVFMYTKDDGLDSGGSDGGDIIVTHSRFEEIFHEGAALSSGGKVDKNHRFSGCIFINCGQGLELGYSSPNHLVIADSCIFRENGIGIRYGDNYHGQHRGKLEVSNSVSIYNDAYDIWNMNRENWTADTLKMEFNHVLISSKSYLYPQLTLYD